MATLATNKRVKTLSKIKQKRGDRYFEDDILYIEKAEGRKKENISKMGYLNDSNSNSNIKNYKKRKHVNEKFDETIKKRKRKSNNNYITEDLEVSDANIKLHNMDDDDDDDGKKKSSENHASISRIIKNERKKVEGNNTENSDKQKTNKQNKNKYADDNCRNEFMVNSRQRNKCQDDSNKSINPNKFYIRKAHSNNSFVKSQQVDNENYEYFEKILEKLQIGFNEDDDKDIFIENVLKEIENKVTELSCNKSTSHLLEKILNVTKDANVFMKFMEAFSSDLRKICTNQFGSHVVESLLKCGVNLLQDRNASYYDDISSSILKFGKYCLNNTDYFLTDDYAAHILCAFIEIWSGVKDQELINKSRRFRRLKKKLQSDNETYESNKSNSIKIINVSEEFLSQLQEFYSKMIERNDLYDCCMNSKTSHIIQALLIALHKRFPDLCQKFVKILMKTLYTQDCEERLNVVFSNKSSSCVIEKILQVSSEEYQKWLWEHFFQNSLVLLLQDPIANFVVQRFFKVIQCKNQFQQMLDDTFPLFEEILKNGFTGIFVNIAEACVRLGTYQSQFMKVIMKTFGCTESEERLVHLASVIMLLMKYEDFDKQKNEIESLFQNITYLGSLLLQHMLNFYKPLKVVNSLLALKDNLKYIACNPKGSRILDAFIFSTYVGEKNRDKLLSTLQPYLIDLACDKHGSRVIDAYWKVSSLKHRTIIAQKLAEDEEKLNQTISGVFIKKKCALLHFKHRKEDWRQVQEEEIKKRKIFKNFIN